MKRLLAVIFLSGMLFGQGHPLGVGGNLTAPGPIGGTTPNTGSFTTLTFCSGFGFITGSTCYATVQATMTAASTNGLSIVPPTYAGTDIPIGTRLNSVFTPTSSSQPSGARLQDYRFGTNANSCFNPNHDALGLNVWYCSSFISWWNQALGNVNNGGTNNVDGVVIQNNVLSGSQNVSGNGYNNKTDFGSLYASLNSYSSGESEGIKHYQNCYGMGDCTAMFLWSADFGGSNANADEGLEGPDLAITQGYVEYSGTISNAPGTGGTSVAVTPTTGTGTQGVGRFLIDVTQQTTTGTITSIAGSTGLNTVTGSGTGWAVSTSTTSSAAITVTGSNTTPGSVNIQVANSTGFTANTLVCVADAAMFEYVKPTSVPDGTHITAVFTLPHASGATMATGGLCGFGLEIDADRWTTGGQVGFVNVQVVQPLRQVWPIIASASATSATIWVSVAAAGDSYAGMGNFPGQAYHLYPMAQVTDVTNAGATVSNTLTTSPNNVAWANGDTVSEVMGPTLKHSGLGNWQINNFFPSQPLGNYQSYINYNGLVSSNDVGFGVKNNTIKTLYTGHSGKLTVPNAFYDNHGLYNYGMAFDVAPDRAMIYSLCPLNSSGAVSCAAGAEILFQPTNGGSSVDNLRYEPATKNWRFKSDDDANETTIGNGFGIRTSGGVNEFVGNVILDGKVQNYQNINTAGAGMLATYAAPGAVTIGSGSSIAATSLCSTALCPAGTYDVAVYVEVTTACATTGGYVVWLGYTDDQGAKTGSGTTTSFPLFGNGTTPQTAAAGASLALASTANLAQAHFVLHTTGAATGGLGSINYGTTATACGSGGPAVGSMFFIVTRLN